MANNNAVGMKCGFDATVSISGSTIKTIGDITYDESKTEIEIKNRASKDIRYIQGMTATNFSMQVQAGIDPEDSSSCDGYSLILNHYNAGTAFSVEFTSPGGFSRTKDMICTAFKPTEPVDGLSVADVTLRVSGLAATVDGGT